MSRVRVKLHALSQTVEYFDCIVFYFIYSFLELTLTNNCQPRQSVVVQEKSLKVGT